MFPLKIWSLYTIACVMLVLAPGPVNLLAVGRGLGQGSFAAFVSALSSGAGILFHALAATCGLTLLIQTSAVIFTGRESNWGVLLDVAWIQSLAFAQSD